MRVLYISSLMHSGSTVLDLMLGCHSRAVGLGEFAGIFMREHADLSHIHDFSCSCRVPAATCPFWSGPFERLRRERPKSVVDRYGIVVDAFKEHFGDDTVLVDSSKFMPSLRVWTFMPDADVRVLHLVRDVRAWSVSMQRLSVGLGETTAKGLIERHGWLAPRRVLGMTMPGRFRAWHRGNRELEDRLAAESLPTLRLSYEGLAFGLEQGLAAIHSFAGLPVEPPPATLDGSDSHILLGNRMHGQSAKRAGFAYDYRWMSRRNWLPAAVAMPWVMAYNQRVVWGPLGDGVWAR